MRSRADDVDDVLARRRRDGATAPTVLCMHVPSELVDQRSAHLRYLPTHKGEARAALNSQRWRILVIYHSTGFRATAQGSGAGEHLDLDG
jgi:hypothetical protein